MFDSTKGVLLVAPSLSNSSCWPNGKSWPTTFPATEDILKAFFIFALSMAILFGNLVLICVLNNRRYIKYIDNQPRYLLTSLALNDLFTGILIAPVALLPALYKCWPYGEIFCQIQALAHKVMLTLQCTIVNIVESSSRDAPILEHLLKMLRYRSETYVEAIFEGLCGVALLRGAVSQQSAVILVCMAIDRYLYLLHPNTYHKHSSKKGCVLVISTTWILSVSLFATMVLPRSGYYFNSTGLMACDVFHSRIAFRILACCAYYFPTTMALMYCYGSGFHVSKTRSKCTPDTRPNGIPISCAKNSRSEHEAIPIQTPVRPHSVSTSRTMAAMSLGFIVMVTPATIQEVVAACTGCKVPPTLDFLVTWLALSDSFWNPFLYWLLNSHFRRISHELLQHYICCRRTKSFQSYEKPAGCCGSSITSEGLHSKGEFEGLGEKYWGEILERTVSSNSLHAIQKCHRDPMRCTGSFKGYHSGTCKHNSRFFDGYGLSDYRQLDRSAFQIEPCSRQCRMKSSDFCLFRQGPGLECGRSRSNLSLDEGNFNKICNGRHPEL